MLRVALVEDSALVRERLRALLATVPEVTVEGEYEDAPCAIDGIRHTRPDVVLLDIKLRASTGMEVLKAVRREWPEVKIIVLTNYAEPQYRKSYLENGAYRFLDKTHQFEQIRGLLLELAGHS